MNFNLKHFSLLGLFFLLIISACNKDPIVDSPVIDPPLITEWEPRIETVTASLQGLVVDKNNEVIIDATVKMNGISTTTNDYGHFFFTNLQMNSKGAYLTVEKEGYFKGSRRFFPQTASKNRVKVEMLAQEFSTEFDAASGGSYAFVNSDVQLVFPANAIKNEATGAAYEGTVFVAAQYLDPNATSTFDQMPGNLQGINASNEEGVLKTLGMMAVELQGAAGEKLNIAEGQTATVSIPVPTGLDNPPAEVPLWSFDEEIGLWVEESIAILENGIYTGEVSHFSFWNWDVYAPSADFFAILTDRNGNPLENIQMKIISSSMGAGTGFTDAAGLVGGMVPADEILTIELYNSCNSLLYSKELGPFAEGTETTENITLDALTINPITITGTVTDCDGTIVTNSFVVIDYDSGPVQHIYTDEQGAFNSTVLFCGDVTEASLTAVDLSNLVQSTPVPLSIDTDNDVGSISACDIVIEEDFFTLTIDGLTKTYIASTEYFSGGFRVYQINGNITIVIQFYGTEAGNYDGELNSLEALSDPDFGWSFFTTSGLENFDVSVFNSDNVSGTFSGEIIGGGTTTIVEGSFSVNPN